MACSMLSNSAWYCSPVVHTCTSCVHSGYTYEKLFTLQHVIRVNTVFTNTRTQSNTPLSNSSLDDAIVEAEACPGFSLHLGKFSSFLPRFNKKCLERNFFRRPGGRGAPATPAPPGYAYASKRCHSLTRRCLRWSTLLYDRVVPAACPRLRLLLGGMKAGAC